MTHLCKTQVLKIITQCFVSDVEIVCRLQDLESDESSEVTKVDLVH